MKKTFKVTNGKGFHITFPNGVTLSTQFGWGNYCENRDKYLPIEEQLAKHDWESDDAEIAIFVENGEWLTRQFKDSGDNVLGSVKLPEWLKAVEWCANYKTDRRGECD